MRDRPPFPYKYGLVSGVLVRSHDGHTVQKFAYQQVLQSPTIITQRPGCSNRAWCPTTFTRGGGAEHGCSTLKPGATYQALRESRWPTRARHCSTWSTHGCPPTRDDCLEDTRDPSLCGGHTIIGGDLASSCSTVRTPAPSRITDFHTAACTRSLQPTARMRTLATTPKLPIH
jgi:hypothetical protein